MTRGLAMDRLGAMRLIVRIADLGSFTRAAADLGLSRTAASKQVKALESALGTALMTRTTRRVALTAAGEGYVERARDILWRLDEAERLAASLDPAPEGVLRVHAPPSFGQRQLCPALKPFLDAYPKLKVEMTLTDRPVDLVEEGYDMALWIDGAPPADLAARRVGETAFALVAAPAYVKAAGAPECPADLTRHRCLVNAHFSANNQWRFTRDGETATVAVDGPLTVNNVDAIREAALAGLGVAFLPAFQVAEELRTGRLWRLLPPWTGETQGIYVVYPPSRLVPAKVRLFTAFLGERLSAQLRPRDRRSLPGGPDRPSTRG
ncbi:hypothetical protein CKO24_00160 [Rhodothalassium salexigens DSM 2132]|nr:hypothetical protein [Rhodothalassium salexigens DSM 2132]